MEIIGRNEQMFLKAVFLLNQSLFNNGTRLLYTIASKQDDWTTFSTLPFLRADIYNITLISQYIVDLKQVVFMNLNVVL